MADMGQDVDALTLKVMEQEVVIEEKIFAKKKIRLEILKLDAQIKRYHESIANIDVQVKEHQLNLDSLQSALKEAELRETKGA